MVRRPSQEQRARLMLRSVWCARLVASSRVVAGLLVLTLLPRCCSLIGFGVGNAIPQREIVAPESIPRDSEVELKLNSTTTRALDGTVVEVRGDYLFVRLDTDHSLRTIPMSSVQESRRTVGSYWLPGLITGIILDAILTAVTVEVISNAMHSFDNQFQPGLTGL
jgi:hypothetical protein